MEELPPKTDLLKVNVSLAVTPAISFVKAFGVAKTVAGMNDRNGFALELEAAMPYETLSTVLNTYLQGKRFELSEGFIKQHVIVEACQFHGNGTSLAVEVPFSGSFSGTVYCAGTPIYNPSLQTIELQHFNYDLRTKNFLLKGAKWLFDKIILEEIKKYSVFNIGDYIKKTSEEINSFLNKEWAKGIQGAGTVERIEITGIQAQQQQLLIRSRCSGNLNITVTETAFSI